LVEKGGVKRFLIYLSLLWLIGCSSLLRGPASFISPYQELGCRELTQIILTQTASATHSALALIRERQKRALPIILDIGGEGRHIGAINLNPTPLTSTTGEPGRVIDGWVPGFGDQIPLPDHSVNQIYLENAPVSIKTLKEMRRVLAENSEIHLLHPDDYSLSVLAKIEEVFPNITPVVESREGLTQIRWVYPLP
jgi:hypothetical protein